MPGDVPFLDMRKWTLFAVNVKSGGQEPCADSAAGSAGPFFSCRRTERALFYRADHSRDDHAVPPRKIPGMDSACGRQPGAAGDCCKATLRRGWYFLRMAALALSRKGRTSFDGCFAAAAIKLSWKISRAHRAIRKSVRGGWLAVIAARPERRPRTRRCTRFIEPTWDVLVVKPGKRRRHSLTGSEKETQNGELAWSGDGKRIVLSFRMTNKVIAKHPSLASGNRKRHRNLFRRSLDSCAESFARRLGAGIYGAERDGARRRIYSRSGARPSRGELRM